MVEVLDRPTANNGSSRLRLRVRDVTGTHFAEIADVDPALHVGTVTEAVAARLALPTDGTPWALRTESEARYLDDVAIGDAVEPGQTVVDLVLTPKAHLG